MQNNLYFYRKHYIKIGRLMLGVSILSFLLMVACVIKLMRRNPSDCYASHTDGSLHPIASYKTPPNI